MPPLCSRYSVFWAIYRENRVACYQAEKNKHSHIQNASTTRVDPPKSKMFIYTYAKKQQQQQHFTHPNLNIWEMISDCFTFAPNWCRFIMRCKICLEFVTQAKNCKWFPFSFHSYVLIHINGAGYFCSCSCDIACDIDTRTFFLCVRFNLRTTNTNKIHYLQYLSERIAASSHVSILYTNSIEQLVSVFGI